MANARGVASDAKMTSNAHKQTQQQQQQHDGGANGGGIEDAADPDNELAMVPAANAPEEDAGEKRVANVPRAKSEAVAATRRGPGGGGGDGSGVGSGSGGGSGGALPGDSFDPLPAATAGAASHTGAGAAFDLSALASFSANLGSKITNSLMGDDLQIDLQRTQSQVRKIERVVKDSDIDKFFNDIVSDIYYQIVTSEQDIHNDLFRQILLMKISLMKEMHSDECENVEHIEKKLDMIDTLMADLNNYIEISSLKQTTELNKVMKFLTIFSAMFIPGTFFTSIFSMNIRIPFEFDIEENFQAFIGICTFLTLFFLFLIWFFRYRLQKCM